MFQQTQSKSFTSDITTRELIFKFIVIFYTSLNVKNLDTTKNHIFPGHKNIPQPKFACDISTRSLSFEISLNLRTVNWGVADLPSLWWHLAFCTHHVHWPRRSLKATDTPLCSAPLTLPCAKHEWQSPSAGHTPGHLVVCRLVVQLVPTVRP